MQGAALSHRPGMADRLTMLDELFVRHLGRPVLVQGAPKMRSRPRVASVKEIHRRLEHADLILLHDF